ncbi:hypothetical protein MBLNU457_g2860t2 [Dothideomycetes sp. NU457]
MDVSWDVESLRSRVAELPPELIYALENFESTRYLEIITRTFLDRRYTDLILVACESIISHCCAEAGKSGNPLVVLSTFARVLPFAPYIAEFVEGYLASRKDDISRDGQTSGNEIEYLLAVFRLIRYDSFTFIKHVDLSELEQFMDHHDSVVRYLALRIISRYLRAADAAEQRIYKRKISKDDATGPWEDKEIHYKYLTSWEEQRHRTMKGALKEARSARAARVGDSVASIPIQAFTTATACISGVLLPRSLAVELNTPSVSTIVATATVEENLRRLASRLKSIRPILVTGVAGSGKTTVVRHAAASVRKLQSMVTLHLNEQSDAKTLIGMYTTGATPGSFSWQAGVLTKAVTEGRWVFIEDIDRAPNEVLSTLLPLIERRELIIPSRDQTIRAARGFRIIASIRTYTDFRGVEVTPALNMLGSRHWRSAHIETPTAPELSEIIGTLYPSLAEYRSTLIKVYDELITLRQQSMLESRSKTGIMRAINQRDLLKWAARIARLLDGKSSAIEKGEQIFLDAEMFLDAVDCFAGSLSEGPARDLLTGCIAQHLQIDPQRRDHLLYNRAVKLEVADKYLTIGVNSFPRVSRRTLPGQAQQTFSTNAHTRRLLERIASAVAEKEPLLLVGETGTGKTTSLQYFANQIGKKVVAFNLSQQSESGDLLGGFKPVNIRSLVIPLKDEFDELFSRSFSSKVLIKNQPFLDLLNKCMAKGQWLRVCKCWNTALGMVEELRLSALSLDSPADKSEIPPQKKRKVDRGLDPALKDRWESFSKEFRNIERRLMSGSESNFAFSFVEGNIVKAVRNGDWVLLDEINLASPDTLEALADLFDKSPSIMLSEAGRVDRIGAHPDFRVFAAMNPATDVGKKDLPLGIRSRFTELYVESPDRDLASLQQIVQVYLGQNEGAMSAAVSRLHQAILDLASREMLVDGAGQKPHFSLRTLTRALSFVRDMLTQCSLRRALYEGFQMSYLTLLDAESEGRVLALLQQHLYGKQTKQMSELKQPMRQPAHESSQQYISEGRYWLKKGDFSVEEQNHYIITDFVRRNLDNLIRASSTRRFPILLQGPTSSGKTSMVEYLAKRSGNKFVRINNHEHTDLQEYLGSYISGSDGKLYFQEGVLVKALREGHWIVLDELNLAPTDVLEALNRLLDDNRELFIPETQETVRPHANFMLFATQNPAGLYGGRKVLSRAFRNRFLELHFDDIPIDELHIILQRRTQIPNSWAQRIVSVYKELALLRQENRMFEQKSFATLRDLFRWALRPADTIDQLAVHGFMILAERVRKSNERAEVKRIIEKVLSLRGPKVVIDEEALYSVDALGLSPESQAALESSGVVWTKAMRRLYVLTLRAIQNNEPVLLVGETGCGKTTVCQMLATAFTKQLFIVNAHQNTETGDLIGAQRPARNRAAHEATIAQLLSTVAHPELQSALSQSTVEDVLKIYDRLNTADTVISEDVARSIAQSRAHLQVLFEWADGSLIHAMKTGQFFLLDEISLADDSVLERLNSVLEPQRSILLAEKCSLESFVTAADGYQFFATMNPGGDYGKKELSPALRNRFTEIWVPALSDDDDVLQVVQSKLKEPAFAPPMIAFARWFQARYNRTAASTISIRDLLAWSEFVNRGAVDPLLAVIHGAAMVYVDSLGANPAALLAVGSAQIAAERKACLEEFGRLLHTDAVAVYMAPVTCIVSDDTLSLGNFSLSRTSTAQADSSFTLQAPRTRENAMRIVRALQLTKPVLIEGNPGVGKTSLVTALAQLTGIPLTRINLSEQTDLMDLFGSDVPMEGAEAGTFAWRDAPFLRAMKSGEWVLLDEMNLASQSVLEGLNACLDHRGEVYISELDQTFQRHPDFRLFAAQNPHHQGGGRKGLPASFVNRFTVVYADVFQQEDLMSICQTSFPGLSTKHITPVVRFMDALDQEITSRRLGTVGSPWEFNLRDTLRWLSLTAASDGLLEAGGPADFLPILISQRFRTQKDRLLVSSLFHSVFADNPDEHILESVMIGIQKSFPVILVGPSGCGKTILIEQLAALTGNNLVTFPLTADIDSMDLVGGYEQSDPHRRLNKFAAQLTRFVRRLFVRLLAGEQCAVPQKSKPFFDHILRDGSTATAVASPETLSWLRKFDESDRDFVEVESLVDELSAILSAPKAIDRAQFEWVDGALVQAVQNGDWLVLDNANLCSPAALDRLNSLLEPNGVLIINEHTNAAGEPHIIKPHSNFRIFLTMDPKYGELSRALRNRAVEICMLQQDGATPAVSDAGLVQLSPESHLHRVRNLQILSSDFCHVQDVSASPLADIALDHLSAQDLSNMTSLQGQLQAKMFNIEPASIVPDLHATVDTAMSLLNEDDVQCESIGGIHSSLQTINPLNNGILLKTGNNSLTGGYMRALAYEIFLAVTAMRQALSKVENKRGPKTSLTRLQRSANARKIPNAARDSTSGVYAVLTELVATFSNIAARHKALDPIGASHPRSIMTLSKSMLRYWWDLFNLTNASDFDEATFSLYKEIGLDLTVRAGETQKADEDRKTFANVLSKMGSSAGLVNAPSMTALWTAYRPTTPKTMPQLEALLALEKLADQFDAMAWTFEGPTNQLLHLRGSFSGAIEAAKTSTNGQSLVQALKETLIDLPIEAAPTWPPHFQAQFAAVCQYVALSKAYGRTKDIAETFTSSSAFLALQPTKLLSLPQAHDSSSSFVNLADQINAPGLSGDNNLGFGFAANAVHQVQKSQDVPLRRLDLLQYEIASLGGLISSSADTFYVDPSHLLTGAYTAFAHHFFVGLDSSFANAPTGALSRRLKNTFGERALLENRLPIQAMGEPLLELFAPSFSRHATATQDLVEIDEALDRSPVYLKRLAVVWITFALCAIRLYTPTHAYDPALKPIIQRSMHRGKRQELETKLAALRQFELHFTGQTSNLRIRQVEDELAEMGDEPSVPEIVRPAKSQNPELQGIFDALLRTIGPLMEVPHSTLSNKFSDKILRSNLAQLKRRLVEDFRAYDDITSPLVGFLNCLEIGFSLGSIARSMDRKFDALSIVTAMTPMTGLHPKDWLKGQPTQSLIEHPLQVQLRFLKTFATVQASGLGRLHGWREVHEILDSTYDQWKIELQNKQQDTATKSSLYTYRGGDDVEEEVSEEEIRGLFPDYDQQTQGESTNQQDDDLTIHSFASKFADVLSMLVRPDTVRVDGISVLMDEVAETAGKLQKLPRGVSGELLPLLIILLDRKQQQLVASTASKTTYNIYADANISEAQKLIALVKRCRSRFAQTQKVWPEHATLGEVLRTCEELLDFRHTDPLAKMITKLEKLHEYVHEWQKVASSEYSAINIYDNITDLIVSWRQLELSTWSRMLDMEVSNCNEDAKSWFFIAYENIVTVPLSTNSATTETRDHVVELLKTLDGFFRSTGLGQFAQRLEMLETLQDYVQIRAEKSVSLALVSSALANFISYMHNFDQAVQNAIGQGRQKLEKDMKNIIQMASWRDRTIASLKQSAKTSHLKLFKIIRKFRTVLKQPVETILLMSVPDNTSVLVNGHLDAKASHMGIDWKESQTVCEQSIPAWAQLPARFRNTQTTLNVMHKMTSPLEASLNSAEDSKVWLQDIENTAAELRKATPSILNDETKETVQHLKVRKRTLFADVLKELREMGFKSNLSGDVLAKQESMEVVLAALPWIAVDASTSIRSSEHSLHRMLQTMPQVRNAAREHSDDLTGAEIARSIALSESILQTIVQQRHTIATAQTGVTRLLENVHIAQNLSLDNKTRLGLSEASSSSYDDYAAVNMLPTILQTTIAVIEAQTRLGKLTSTEYVATLRNHVAQISQHAMKISTLPRMPQGLTHVSIDETRTKMEEKLSDLRVALTNMKEELPTLKPVINQALMWATPVSQPGMMDDNQTGEGHSESSLVHLPQYLQSACGLVDLVLGSFEDMQKSLTGLPQSTDDSQWLLREGTALTAALRALRIDQVMTAFAGLLNQLQHLTADDRQLDLGIAMIKTFAAIVECHQQTFDDILNRLLDLHKSVCHMGDRLTQIFVRLAKDGFCTPSDKTGGKDEGNEKLEGGTGLGEGEGGEDISKDIGADEDLGELAQQQDEGDKDKDEIEDEKDAIDMADADMEGQMGDAEEKDEGEDGDEGPEKDDEEMDEEAGDVDDLGPSTVDEKMWDDGGKKDADKDQETDKADGTVDEDDMAAAEGEKKEEKEKEKPEGDKEEDGDDAPEEEVGAEENEEVGANETEKADPHTQEQDNLDLPDNIDMDGQGSDNDNDEDMGDMGDDMLDEKDAGPEEQAEEQGEEMADGEVDDPADRSATPEIGEDEDVDSTEQVPEEEEGQEKTQDAGEDAEEDQAVDDENVLQDNRQDESKAADEIAPSEAQGTGASEPQPQDQNAKQDAGAAEQQQGVESAAQEKQQAAGAQGQRGAAQENQPTAGEEQEQAQEEESMPYKKLGDALEKWYKQQRQIADAQEREQDRQQAQDADMADVEFEHLPDETTDADAQALGAATEEQATAIDEDAGLPTNDQETHDFFPPEEAEQERQEGQDVEMQEAEPTETDQTEAEESEAQANAFVGEYKERPADIERSRAEAKEDEEMEDIHDESTAVAAQANTDASLPLDVDEARHIWSEHESATRTLALTLTEHLRLILAPTQATKMRGDFRTGKRLNIKRIIPYIASQYKRDKIWMRRSVPSKRAYQIMLAIDDSKSMGESGSSALAFDTLALISRSLTMLEAGDLAIVGFGSDMSVVHDFGTPFSSDSGANVVQSLRFEQSATDVRRLLERSLDMFAEARLRSASSSAAELWQLQLIVSDGVCKDHGSIRQLVRRAAEERIMIVFVIVDPAAASNKAGTGGSSILDLQTANFGKDAAGNMVVETVKYLETFPFRYYLIVRDVGELPGVLASALRQWFAEVVDTA